MVEAETERIEEPIPIRTPNEEDGLDERVLNTGGAPHGEDLLTTLIPSNIQIKRKEKVKKVVPKSLEPDQEKRQLWEQYWASDEDIGLRNRLEEVYFGLSGIIARRVFRANKAELRKYHMNLDDIESIANEKLAEIIPGYEPKSNFGTFLQKCVWNAMKTEVRHYKSGKRIWWRSSEQEERFMSNYVNKDAKDVPSQVEEPQIISTMRALLTPIQYDIVMMRVVDKMTNAECAEATGLSVGTVKYHRKKAFDKLQDTVNSIGGWDRWQEHGLPNHYRRSA